MLELYNIIFLRPIFNALIWLYNVIPGADFGVAIIILTVILKIILYPFSVKALKSQRLMQALQPKLQEVQQKYKEDKQGLARATMELYKQEKVSPFSSCLPLLVQFPFLIALYQALRSGLTGLRFDLLYPFVGRPENLNVTSFGFLNLAKPDIVLAVLAGASQFWQTKMLQASQPPRHLNGGAQDERMMATMNKQMMYFMPLMTIFIGVGLPSGLILYWLVTTLLTILQQWWFFRNPHILPLEKGEKQRR